MIVEGSGAYSIACGALDAETYAVLALQSKPVSIDKREEADLILNRIDEALGGSRSGQLRYSKIALLFNPEIDGAYITALVYNYIRKTWADRFLSGSDEFVFVMKLPTFIAEGVYNNNIEAYFTEAEALACGSDFYVDNMESK